MTLFLARSYILSTPVCLPRLHFGSHSSNSKSRSQVPATWKRVHHHRHVLIQSCAVTLGNGGLDDGGDGAGFVSPSTDSSPMLKSSGTSTTVGSSGSEPKGEEPWISRIESGVERTIFNFRFLTLTAIGGSLVGSLLCFLKGCGFVLDSYTAYFGMCLNGLHTGKVILRLVEAVEIYLVGTVMLIFGMGLFGLFISNGSDQRGQGDRALRNTTLFGMFALTKRPLWMQITTLDTLKTKLGHCIVMILIVKLFEKSKTVCIASSVDLLLYSIAIFLAAGSLYVLQQLHANQFSNTQS
ncbi:hypothetical protein M758_8G060400 [Ceratodon purpureus]|nr:hypothetical protein M758_8G060400 [Ceratodon purpureus]